MENSMNPFSSNQTKTTASNLWQPNTAGSSSTQLPIHPIVFNNFFSRPSQTLQLYPPATLSLPSSQSFQSQLFPPAHSGISQAQFLPPALLSFASSQSSQSQFFPSAPSGSLQSQFLPPAPHCLPSIGSIQQRPYLRPVKQEGLRFGYPVVYPSPESRNGPSIGAADDGQRSFLLQTSNIGPTVEQERRLIPDPNGPKLARIRRRLTRQRTLSLQGGSSSMQPSAAEIEARRFLAVYGHPLDANNNNNTASSSNNNNENGVLYVLLAPENKRLRVLLKKQLKKSDVGVGRIILPKREAEENLPTLYDGDREGVLLPIRDVYNNEAWTFKYKFWKNNLSRMYILENTGDFVRTRGLRTGDLLIFYEDDGNNYYFSVEREGRPAWVRPADIQNVNSSSHHISKPISDEDETLAVLIEQLKDIQHQEAAGLLTSMPQQPIIGLPTNGSGTGS